MYGGDAAKTHVAQSRVLPPLRKLWESTTGGGFSPYCAAVVDSTLIVGTLIGEIHLLNISTGKDVGTTDVGTAITGTPIPDGPIIYVSLTNDQHSLIAYNLRSEKNEWVRNVGDVESSPLLLNGRLYVTTLNGKLECVNKSTGEELWSYGVPSAGRTPMIHSSPASDGQALFFGADNGNLYAVDIQEGKLKWQAGTGGALMASPSVSEGKVFIGSLDKTFYAFDATTGACVWKRVLGARIFSSQAVDERHVYVGTTEGIFYCLNKNDGSTVWTDTAGSVFNATPLVTNGVVYAGCTDRILYAFDSASGRILWQYKGEGRIKTMPLVWNDKLILLAEDDVVSVFENEAGK